MAADEHYKEISIQAYLQSETLLQGTISKN